MQAQAVLLDLLMATMNSLEVWASAAGDRALGLTWRDGVTHRMSVAGRYVPYDTLVAEVAADVGLAPEAPEALRRAWREMEPWPDAAALGGLAVPYAFLTNSSTELAVIASERSGAAPRFVLAAEEVGWYKPDPATYLEACRRIGAPPAETLFVAGSPYDAAGARNAGLPTVLIVRRPDHRPPAGIPAASSLHELVELLRQANLPFAPECEW